MDRYRRYWLELEVDDNCRAYVKRELRELCERMVEEGFLETGALSVDRVVLCQQP